MATATLSDDMKAILLDAAGAAFDVSGEDCAYFTLCTAADAVAATIYMNEDAYAAAAGTGTVEAALDVDPELIDENTAGHADDITKLKAHAADGTLLLTWTAGLDGDSPTPGFVMAMATRKLAAGQMFIISSGKMTMS